MARQFGRRPSDLYRLRDETVAYALDIAATWLLHKNDQIAEENRQGRLLAALAGGLTGGSSVEWETVEEF